MTATIEPFHLAIPEAALDDLRDRLDRTRWPERETVADWGQGAPLETVQALCRYWRDTYDWRRAEAMLNGFGQHRTSIDGLGIHFLHIRSPEPGAMPLLMTHGWPGSVIEFHKVIGPLTDPVAHGGNAADAFHIVAPSLPGYGFSDRPAEAGWSVERIAHAWIELMDRLGYQRFVAQGGDWGSAVTSAIGAIARPSVAGIHLNMVIARPADEDMDNLTPAEQTILTDMKRFTTGGNGYAQIQGTRPQTLGYGLTDLPAGQAAWILEKLTAWSDCGGDPFSVFSHDEILDNIMVYWLTATATSSARLYWQSIGNFNASPVAIPVACSIFPREIIRASRRWAERKYSNLIYWNELDRGGHFAAFEQPDLFVDELRNAFRPLR